MNPRFFTAASNLSIVASAEFALELVMSPSTANAEREVAPSNMTMDEATRPGRLKVLLGAMQTMQFCSNSLDIAAKGVCLYPL